MAPLHSSHGISRLQIPQMRDHASEFTAPFYSSTSLSCSTTQLSTILPSSTTDLDDTENTAALSPRTLYALSFDRPASARSLPSGKFKKNMKEMTGFGTTEEDFDALPTAIQRKSEMQLADPLWHLRAATSPSSKHRIAQELSRRLLSIFCDGTVRRFLSG
ncbi:hypothetical protein BDZ45DRAFT_35037 [Acephala macrosclerotiorum]|nr:hypothetical protein BDZ45DRAFT_35037 [Acephala macrosclerotiorum]